MHKYPLHEGPTDKLFNEYVNKMNHITEHELDAFIEKASNEYERSMYRTIKENFHYRYGNHNIRHRLYYNDEEIGDPWVSDIMYAYQEYKDSY